MRYWRTDNGIIGDGPAHIMTDAIEDIRTFYRQDLGRDPTKLEICDLVALVLEAIDIVDSANPDRQTN